jgi:hypothetical protein
LYYKNRVGGLWTELTGSKYGELLWMCWRTIWFHKAGNLLNDQTTINSSRNSLHKEVSSKDKYKSYKIVPPSN